MGILSSNKIAIIQFPGSNTERETSMACIRVGLFPVEFLWNQPLEELVNFDGYIIIGGFSYEDRSRAGAIAALDPIINQIKIEANKGKPVLGICNGAQVLVESGLVPGLKDNQAGVALTDNKRIINNHIVGVGYFNVWSNLKMTVSPERCAFTRHLKTGESINVPLAHGEGRFIIPKKLLNKMIENNQTIYQYCNEEGHIVDEFPTNPNGSIYNLAAICNPAGNVMAMMPHPERTKNGDVVFSSMKEFISIKKPTTKHTLSYQVPGHTINNYVSTKDTKEWLVDMIITDNEAVSVQNALVHLGLDVSITRQTHWEIGVEEKKGEILNRIEKTGELYNSNKEFIVKTLKKECSASFLIRQKDDVLGRLKLESLRERFEINEISNLKYGVIWNLTINSGNIQSVINQILNTHILYNPQSYECYKIN